MATNWKAGDQVQCLRGDIDYNKHAGETGVIEGFTRFSSYHPREATVRFADGDFGYFWLSSLTSALPLSRTERFTGSYADSFAA